MGLNRENAREILTHEKTIGKLDKLSSPNYKRYFVLRTNASKIVLVAVLMQINENEKMKPMNGHPVNLHQPKRTIRYVRRKSGSLLGN